MFATTLYLDFDGVFNAKQPKHDRIEQFIISVENSINFLPQNLIIFSPTVVEWVENHRTQYNAELVWLTSWNENNTVLRLSDYLGGLDNGRVLPANLHTEQVSRKEWTQWKAEAILKDQQANQRPFVWVDDNAHAHWGDHVKNNTVAPSLFLTPQSAHGLQVEELKQMDDFLAEYSH